MSEGVDITKIKAEVMAIELGIPLDEAIAREVYHLRNTGIVGLIRNPIDGKKSGDSTWRTKEDLPVKLPMFSTVSFVCCLMIEDINKEINIQRTPEGHYNVSFMGFDDSNVDFLCPYFSEGIARAVLFETRFEAAVESLLAAAAKNLVDSVKI